MKANNCPCEECITRPICSGKKSLIKLMDKCLLLSIYITDTNAALDAAKVIKPYWLYEDGMNVEGILESVLAFSEDRRNRNG